MVLGPIVYGFGTNSRWFGDLFLMLWGVLFRYLQEYLFDSLGYMFDRFGIYFQLSLEFLL